MRFMPNEFALTHPTPNHFRRESPPAIGWALMLGMAPVLFAYWLLLALVTLFGGLVSFAHGKA